MVTASGKFLGQFQASRASRPCLSRKQQRAIRPAASLTTKPVGAATVGRDVEPATEMSTEPEIGTLETFGAETDDTKFNWLLQWYPIEYVHNLDPKVPYPFTLVNQRLVLWSDGSGTWRTFLDSCPHRLAPLSEGRIEEDGTLSCSYHGWRFDGGGACTDIPQALDAKAKQRACASPRSCATSFPTQVWQDKVWVFATGGATGAMESMLVRPALLPECSETDRLVDRNGGEVLYSLHTFCRDVPYDFSILIENLTDPSHINFSHHGVIGDRDHELAGHVKISPGKPFELAPSPQDSFTMEVEQFMYRSKAIQRWPLNFAAPCLTQWQFYMPWGNKGSLNLYCIPTTTGKARVLVDVSTAAKGTPWIVQQILRYKPRWIDHIQNSNKILDGDAVFLYGQGYNMAEKVVRGEPGGEWRSYFMPSQADRFIAKTKQWLDNRGGGGPTPLKLGDSLPPLETRKEVLLDRYHSHTKNCPECSGALRGFEIAQTLMLCAAAACFLGVAATLGRGFALASVPLLAFSAGVAASLALWRALKEYAVQFRYWDYSHATNNEKLG